MLQSKRCFFCNAEVTATAQVASSAKAQPPTT
jgi:hypothetical protein